MSTAIYTSEKVMPYVYMGTHKETGQFYIGYCANKKQKLPSHLDLGIRYFTSSKYVKELGFENFDWIILAEFFKGEDALAFEETLLKENWKHTLSLNFSIGGSKFNTLGKSDTIFSEEARRKISEAGKRRKCSNSHKEKIIESNKTRITTEETRKKMSDSRKTRITTEETRKRQSASGKGRPKSEETKKKMSDSHKGKSKEIVTCPHCNKSGGKGNMTRFHFDNCKLRDHSNLYNNANPSCLN